MSKPYHIVDENGEEMPFKPCPNCPDDGVIAEAPSGEFAKYSGLATLKIEGQPYDPHCPHGGAVDCKECIQLEAEFSTANLVVNAVMTGPTHIGREPAQIYASSQECPICGKIGCPGALDDKPLLPVADIYIATPADVTSWEPSTDSGVLSKEEAVAALSAEILRLTNLRNPHLSKAAEYNRQIALLQKTRREIEAASQ